MIYLYNKIYFVYFKIYFKIFRSEFKPFSFKCKEVLSNNFKKGNKFTFIQIGANDGISFDYLFDFIISRISFGILVEPILEYFLELEYNYRNFPKIQKINKALHTEKKEMIVYKIKKESYNKYPEWVKGVSSFDPEHHKKLNIFSDDVEEILVKCITFNELITSNYRLKHLDYLQVDTEGFDAEVIKMIDFERIRPKIIKFEHVCLSEKDILDAKTILENNNYYVFEEDGDTIAVDLKKVKLF